MTSPDARSYLQHFMALVGRRVRQIGRTRRRRTLASACRGQRARLRRRRKFVDSSVLRGSTKPANGGQECQPGLTFAHYFANGRKRLIEQMFPSPLALVVGSRTVHPETNASHSVQGAGFGQTFVANAQTMMFHGGFLRECIVVAR